MEDSATSPAVTSHGTFLEFEKLVNTVKIYVQTMRSIFYVMIVVAVIDFRSSFADKSASVSGFTLDLRLPLAG